MAASDPVKALNAAMHRDHRITGHNARIDVDVEDDALVLLGEARHIAAKRRAAALAVQHCGNRYRVVDRLRRDVTRNLGDAELAQTVAERLFEEPVFAEHTVVAEDGGRHVTHDAGEGAYSLVVSAADGVARLEGTVGSLTHRRLAEVVAWWTGGCADVINDLRIVPEQEDSDNELTDAVRMAIEKDPIVDASQVRIGTAAGVVHVEGLMPNVQQREAVLEDVWLVPGVFDVVDRIEVART